MHRSNYGIMVQQINQKLKKTEFIYFGIFIVGIILAIVSLFLPWETVYIDANGYYQYLPFSGWVVHSYNMYDDMPADVSYLFTLFIIIAVYCGVVIPLFIYSGNKNVPFRGNYYPIKDFLLYIGPILMGVTLFAVSLALITNYYFLPYINIYVQYEAIERWYSYVMSEGMIIAFVSVILMSFGASMLQTQVEGLPPQKIKSSQQSNMEGTESITQTPREIEEEYQKVEDQIAHALFSKYAIKANTRAMVNNDTIANKKTKKPMKEDSEESVQPHGGELDELELE
jgi:hypothetical protein